MKVNHIGIALLFVTLLSSYMKTDSPADNTIFDFDSSSDLSSWRILNDNVMGGVSTASFELNNKGHGVFKGEVLTANNGGFASVRYRPEELESSKKKKVSLRIKGDGKEYQFRVKKNVSDFESYITTFQTNGSWQTIEIDLSTLYPSFRGRKLNQENYDSSSLTELSFLIANKRNESFKLMIDHININ